jgi:adenine-specific DNA-methyltransferase
MTEPQKMDLTSGNISDEQRAKLHELFPEVFTEGGKVDFERLKLTLGEMVDGGKERYGMNWPGKADCFKTIQQSSVATLVPDKKESVNFDETENLIIEGDNLEVLKLLQKSYMGKIKMIYIDPPYNTGNDFIYPDNYSESLETYLKFTGQVDNTGRVFSTNTEADGRFHSRWLNMIYPRLFLARNLLTDDGTVVVSIDDNEVDNLKKICNEIFGEENFIAQVAVLTNPKGRVMDRHFSRTHDYLLIYAKNGLMVNLSLPKSDDEVENDYPENDADGKYRLLELRNTHRQFGKYNRPNLWYPLYADPENSRVSLEKKKGFQEVFPRWEDGFEGCWSWGKDKVQDENHLLVARPVLGKLKIYRKAYSHSKDGEVVRKKLKTILIDKNFYTEKGQAAFDELFGERIFQSPKPLELISTLVKLCSESSDLILDFYAGSGTTGQAVLTLNNDEGGRRKFILVQLPEPIEIKGLSTIAEITKERMRRVIKKLTGEGTNQLRLGGGDSKLDRGFKVFKLQSSNFKSWSSEVPADTQALGKQLEMHVDHIVAGRTQDDILYEILLKSGFPLTTKIETLTLAGKPVYSLQDGAMLICLEKKLNLDLIRAMADQKPKPSRVVCLDEGFKDNDQLKTNAVQTFKTKGITTFRTV